MILEKLSFGSLFTVFCTSELVLQFLPKQPLTVFKLSPQVKIDRYPSLTFITTTAPLLTSPTTTHRHLDCLYGFSALGGVPRSNTMFLPHFSKFSSKNNFQCALECFASMLCFLCNCHSEKVTSQLICPSFSQFYKNCLFVCLMVSPVNPRRSFTALGVLTSPPASSLLHHTAVSPHLRVVSPHTRYHRVVPTNSTSSVNSIQIATTAMQTLDAAPTLYCILLQYKAQRKFQNSESSFILAAEGFPHCTP